MRVLPRDFVVALLAAGPLPVGTALADEQGTQPQTTAPPAAPNAEATGQPGAPREIDFEIKHRM